MTFVGFPDISVESKQGTFTAEARSPVNKTINQRDGSPPDPNTLGFKYGDHQRGFRYQLLDGQTGRVVWERWQGEDEDSPHELFVADDGWTVIRTHGYMHAGLIAISPAGKETLRVGISDREPGPAGDKVFYIRDENVHDTTAGLLWTMGAIDYFFQYEGRSFFCYVTGWGRRLVLNLEGGKLLDNPAQGTSLAEACYVAETDLVLPGIANATYELNALPAGSSERESYWEHWPNLSGQIACVIRNGFTDALPSLKALESQSIEGGYTGCNALPGDRWVLSYCLRPLLCLAIRYFGDAPAGYACYGFFNDQCEDEDEADEDEDEDDESKREFLPVPECVPRRDELVGSIAFGMNSLQVLELLGVPDYLKGFAEERDDFYIWGEHWEYYRGQAKGLVAIRLTWEPDTDGGVLRSVETIPLTREAVHRRVYEIIGL